MNAKVQAILKPDGLRRTKARQALAEFDRSLRGFSEVAKWGDVHMNDDFEVGYEGRPYALLSDSEKYRVRVTLQVALAAKDRDGRGSDLLVFDGADILDRWGRNGLVRLACAAGRPVLICMTLASKEETPNLVKVGGVSYWIENNTATKL